MSLELAAKVQAFNEAVDKPLTLVSQVTLAVNISLAYGLKHMWSMMNILQFIIFMASFKINIDPFAKTLLEQLKKLALFEFIDTAPIKTAIKDFLRIGGPEYQGETQSAKNSRNLSEKDNEKEEQQSFAEPSVSRLGSNDLLENSGVMILAAVAMIILIAALLVVRVVMKNSPRARAIVSKINQKIFFNALIRFLLQSNLKMQIAAAAVLALSYGDIQAEEKSGSQSAKITLAFYNLVPLGFALAIYALKSRLEEEKIEKRIGSLYVGLQTQKVWSHINPVVFMWRRSLFVVIAFCLLDYPGLQV